MQRRKTKYYLKKTTTTTKQWLSVIIKYTHIIIIKNMRSDKKNANTHKILSMWIVVKHFCGVEKYQNTYS